MSLCPEPLQAVPARLAGWDSCLPYVPSVPTWLRKDDDLLVLDQDSYLDGTVVSNVDVVASAAEALDVWLARHCSDVVLLWWIETAVSVPGGRVVGNVGQLVLHFVERARQAFKRFLESR